MPLFGRYLPSQSIADRSGRCERLVYNSGTFGGIRSGDSANSSVPSQLQVSYRYGRITFNQTTPPECGRLMAGMPLGISPQTCSFRQSAGGRSDDPSRHSFSIGQNVFIDELEPRRGYRLPFEAFPTPRRFSQVDEFNRLRGTARGHPDLLR